MRALPVLIALAACGDDATVRPAPSRLASPAAKPLAPVPHTFSVAGSVIDRDTREPVGGVEVVVRGATGDIVVTSAGDGTFTLTAPRGRYRVFVRDNRVMSTGMQGRLRLRAQPRVEAAGVIDEHLMPVLDIDGPTSGVELTVTVGATVRGLVTDPLGAPAPGVAISAVALEQPITRRNTPAVTAAIVRRTAPRPVLGTDIAVSADDGRFTLRVPAGRYSLVANHPTFAGIGGIAELELDAGASMDTTLTLVRGCVISGRVVTSDGTPVHDGAIETQTMGDISFGPSGRVNSDGTFRWTSTDVGFVAIRAWPWRQPASSLRTFDCRDGKTYADVVLTIPRDAPDLGGTLSDARGMPVPLAHIDVASLDRPLNGQQERVDSSGRWDVFSLPAGRYLITASAAGRGIVSTTVTAPRTDIALTLSGTGRIAGTTTELVDGSFELTLHHCGSTAEPIELDDESRIVIVRGGRFTIDNVPACSLTLTARWRDRLLTQSVVVEPDRTAYLELPVGSPRKKEVRGLVRDDAGKPVANARITAIVDNDEATTVRAGSDGRFTIATQSGAQLVAGNGKAVGRASVGRANVPAEQVDITLTDRN